MRGVGRCTAYRSCRRRAKYINPANLCSKHWHAWESGRLKVRRERRIKKWERMSPEEIIDDIRRILAE